MKTIWLSFFILYVARHTDARFLRGLIAAVAIEDHREYNNALPQTNDGVVVSGNGRKFVPPFLNSNGKIRYSHADPPR